MADGLIDDYLHEVKVAAWVRQLSPAQTAELESEARGRIDQSLVAEGNQDQETVYRVLDRLGSATEFVAQHGAPPPSALRQATSRVLAPVTGTQAMLRQRGWGLAEIGGLLLLIVGPFLLWWLGPIFGILLIRYAAERWSDRRMRTATTVVFALLAVQAVMAIVLFVLALGGALPGNDFQLLVTLLGGNSPGSAPTTVTGVPWLSPSTPLEFIVMLPAPLAGVSTGLYLALSPRHRP